MDIKKTELIEIEEAGKTDYLSLPTNELLDAFGQGNHIPGSGSAAALSGLIVVELMKTVLTLSIKKPEYENYKGQFEYILKEINSKHKPKLTELFNTDIQEFHKVSYYRRLRDKSEPKSKDYEDNHKLSIDKLKDATDIPIEICKTSMELLDYALSVFDNGWKAVRGDSGVAISNLLSSAQGALFVVFLNLKTFKKSKWKDEKMNEAVELAVKFTKVQKDAYERVVNLYNENSDNKQLTLDFYK